MIICIIALSLLAVITIGTIVFAIIYCRKNKDADEDCVGGCFISILCLIFLMFVPSGILYTNYKGSQQEIYAFKQQKNYIETVVPTLSDLDNASITQAKLEYNTWLYNAQYEYQYRRWTTFYTNEIMKLEEIK